MKAVQINGYGGVDVLEFVKDAPKPVPDKDQVLVEVYASSLNPFNYKIREGYLKDSMPLKFPAILGSDFAGVISELGGGVSGFKIGDRVYGSALTFSGGSGSFAEFATARISSMEHMPQTTDFIHAAALPIVGSSAVQAIEEHINLQKGQKILIHGGAGGIGHIAIQISKSIGAYVATTVSTDDMNFAKEIGADEVIDYKTQKFEEILKDLDAVFDTVGGETTSKSFKVLKRGGVLVSMVGKPDQDLAEKYRVSAIGQGTQTNAEHLKKLAQLVDNGIVKVSVDKIYPLEQVKDAFTYQEKIHPRGKVVLKIK